MEISAAIHTEWNFFLLSMGCGAGLVLLYDGFRIFRRLWTHGNIWIGVEDLCYWLFSAAVVFLMLYRENDGMLRAYGFLGLLVGVAAYHVILSPIVIKISVGILGGMLRCFQKLLRKFLGPLYRFGRKNLRFLWKWLKKICKTIKIGLCKL